MGSGCPFFLGILPGCSPSSRSAPTRMVVEVLAAGRSSDHPFGSPPPLRWDVGGAGGKRDGSRDGSSYGGEITVAPTNDEDDDGGATSIVPPGSVMMMTTSPSVAGTSVVVVVVVVVVAEEGWWSVWWWGLSAASRSAACLTIMSTSCAFRREPRGVFVPINPNALSIRCSSGTRRHSSHPRRDTASNRRGGPSGGDGAGRCRCRCG